MGFAPTIKSLFARFKPLNRPNFLDPELNEAEEALAGISHELKEIESVAQFFEKNLEIAKNCPPSMRPNYTGAELPHFLEGELRRGKIKKFDYEWTLNFFDYKDYKVLKVLVEDDWFSSIDDQMGAPFEVIARGIAKKKPSSKILRMILSDKFGLDERRKDDVQKFLDIINKRNDLQKRCNVIVKRIGRGELDSLLG